ncbi:flavin reductase (DIM6/NTAB) family NADH-FMN oxidoreductase RutF [Bacillus thermophilus]|uniref:Flavin reductase (DIM6/NTAB) family NADH-FMN oxidoreductase RutF n=1 Tax=Siminovitchia thermophila TaxID=1245522 RepID=A0ABS2RA93_9BACI|nr:flavin reductase (DIM6/NTAB) family NADH-FMN oxidoreductase RutF [Siminovitchia thermophila]
MKNQQKEHGLPIVAGDHTILIGKVIDIRVEKRDPMLYHRRNFGSIPAEFYINP